MKLLFKDLPKLFFNIEDLVKKIETYELSREVLLPKFIIPDDFKSDKNDEKNKSNHDNINPPSLGRVFSFSSRCQRCWRCRPPT